MDELRGILADIAEITDEATAAKLATAFGGTYVEVPKKPRDTSPLTLAVGMEAACKISKELGHGRLLIPMGSMRGEAARRAAAAKMVQDGASTRETSLAVGIHERTVRRVKARLRANDLPLFSETDLPKAS